MSPPPSPHLTVRTRVHAALAAAILEVTEFGLFPAGSRAVAFFKAVLRALSGPDLTKFLLFLTAQSAVPPPSKRIRIVPMIGPGASSADAFPVAHTCFHRLELPDYPSKEVMMAKLRFCIDNVEMAGFGIA